MQDSLAVISVAFLVEGIERMKMHYGSQAEFEQALSKVGAMVKQNDVWMLQEQNRFMNHVTGSDGTRSLEQLLASVLLNIDSSMQLKIAPDEFVKKLWLSIVGIPELRQLSHCDLHARIKIEVDRLIASMVLLYACDTVERRS